MKRGLLVICLIILLSISFVSAGWFGDFWGKITGKVISDSDYLIENISGFNLEESSCNVYEKEISCGAQYSGENKDISVAVRWFNNTPLANEAMSGILGLYKREENQNIKILNLGNNSVYSFKDTPNFYVWLSRENIIVTVSGTDSDRTLDVIKEYLKRYLTSTEIMNDCEYVGYYCGPSFECSSPAVILEDYECPGIYKCCDAPISDLGNDENNDDIRGISEINQKVKDGINSLVSTDNSRKVIVYPPTRLVKVQKGEQDLGFGFSIRNVWNETDSFSYLISAEETSCDMRLSEAEDLITLGKDRNNLIIPAGNIMDAPVFVRFGIPETTPLCQIKYSILVSKGTQPYGPNVEVDLKIYSNEGGELEETQIISPTEETGPVDIPQETEEDESVEGTSGFICNGCELNNKCYPIGYRTSRQYCSDDLKFIFQSETDTICNNNFECSSNVCVSGECVSEGLIKKILNWFMRVFGGE